MRHYYRRIVERPLLWAVSNSSQQSRSKGRCEKLILCGGDCRHVTVRICQCAYPTRCNRYRPVWNSMADLGFVYRQYEQLRTVSRKSYAIVVRKPCQSAD